ncbi:MAG: hypothetical protein ABSF97_14410 [Candidatus Sulfotelmatobacter sp.]|jgi:hypothetical protein
MFCRQILRLAILPVVLFLCVPALFSRSEVRNQSVLNSNYVPALAAADHFLQFWQAGDKENGIALLSSHAKTKVTADGLDQFFSNPVSAYEIGRGTLMKDGRYEFAVALVEAAANRRARRRFSSIIVVNTGNNDWAVDKLP